MCFVVQRGSTKTFQGIAGLGELLQFKQWFCVSVAGCRAGLWFAGTCCSPGVRTAWWSRRRRPSRVPGVISAQRRRRRRRRPPEPRRTQRDAARRWLRRPLRRSAGRGALNSKWASGSFTCTQRTVETRPYDKEHAVFQTSGWVLRCWARVCFPSDLRGCDLAEQSPASRVEYKKEARLGCRANCSESEQ